MSQPLAGLGVLVTRPAHQSAPLCRLLEEQGAIPFLFPVLAIVAPEDTAALRAVLARLHEFDWAIFISPNAVTYAQHWLTAVGGLPSGLTVAAVGQGSAQALERVGIAVDLVPSGRFDSESLLAMPRLSQVQGQRVILFRGEGGRELLADELTRRGATVAYAEVYRRVKPATDPTELLHHLGRHEIQVAVVTSTEGLHNLYDLLGVAGQDWLRDATLVLLSERSAGIARTLGLRGTLHVAKQATDAAILEALLHIQAQRQAHTR